MDNNKKTITPNEMNKYAYCSYQWYYERFYGGKKLRKLAAKRNEGGSVYKKKAKQATVKRGYNKQRYANFRRGNDVHATFHKAYKMRIKVFKCIAVFIFILIFVIFIKVIMNV